MNRFIIWFKRVLILSIIFASGSLISKIFGADSVVTNAVNDNFIYTPYNIVGVIMVIAAVFGVWFGKKGGGKLLFAIGGIMTIAGWIVNISKIFGISDEPVNSLNSIFKPIKTIGFIIACIIAFWVILSIVLFIIDKIKELKSPKNVHMLMPQIEPKLPSTKIHIKKEIEIKPQIEEVKTIAVYQNPEPNDDIKISLGICPVCGAKLKSRQNSHSGKWFKGCSNYPNCSFTVDYPIYKRLQEKYQ